MGEKQTGTIQWYTDALKIDFLVNNAGVICLDRILPPTVEPSPHSSPNFEFSKLPLVSIRMSGEGSGDIKTAKTLIGTTLSDRLRYQSHRIIKSDDGSNETLIVECDFKDSIYLAAGGPMLRSHGWKKRLSSGQSFTTVPIACCRVQGDEQAAFAAIIDYRRQIRRPHNDMERMPIIFDDYMNCFMGDPDGNKVCALLEPVGQLGAEYFVIDAGWYADDGNWWDDVGLWEPSTKRFPSGFMKLMGEIRNKGLIPAYGSSQRWSASVALSYITQGTAGAAHLEHQRAYLGWIRALLDNYPGVLIETCSGGANRLDYAMLAVHSIQSTSNQQDPKLYAAIAAACPTAVTPEQSASWAYPQPGCSDKLNALSFVNSMMGHVDLLSDNRLAIVKEGLEVYESMRGDLRHAHPTWPLGLPKWHDD
ncbi:alpha-galactosidase [Colletotrichum abscissum]|uniref:alpha-galactosidase n=1 Tax=Colletotrichum abscissum TaxID=1671311 RepID=UPI0027D4BA74|nr:alpha-galactosidase [Colletotrichum abscissum]KAK1525497.1 alpha-galactosidase [Colletotrichum abscissum]